MADRPGPSFQRRRSRSPFSRSRSPDRKRDYNRLARDGTEVKEEEEGGGRRRIEPQWLGQALFADAPGSYVHEGHGAEMVVHERHGDPAGFDRHVFAEHLTYFVRSVIPYLYSDVPGFEGIYVDALQNWTYDPRVMNIFLQTITVGNAPPYIQARVPAFPLLTQLQQRKPAGHDRFWSLVPPRNLTVGADGKAVVARPEGRVSVGAFPGPELLPVDGKGGLTEEGREFVRREQRYGPVRVAHASHPISHWRALTPWRAPLQIKNDPSSPNFGTAPPPSHTGWECVLSGAPGGGAEDVKVSVSFEAGLTAPLERLLREEREEEKGKVRIKEERALGKGRRVYEPLARRLF
ncbi:hypothetical protein JCM6882_005471 [Rhodosporidiobolus microsporus]